ASLMGAYGLTWITLAAAASPALIAEGWKGRVAIASAAGVLAALFALGAQRLADATPTPAAALWVRIVQANVAQETKYDEAAFGGIVARCAALPARPAAHRPDIIVWPEGAVPASLDDYMASGAWTVAAFERVFQPGQVLVVGGYRFAPGTRDLKAFNSL